MARTREWLRDILAQIRTEIRQIPGIAHHNCAGLGENLADCPICTSLQSIQYALASIEFCRAYGLVGPDFMTEGEKSLIATLGRDTVERMMANQVNKLSSFPEIICSSCGGINQKFITKSLARQAMYNQAGMLRLTCMHCAGRITLREDELSGWLTKKQRSNKPSVKPNLVKEGKVLKG